jgi:hypothetical protein
LQEKQEKRSNLHTCQFLLSTILPKMTGLKNTMSDLLKKMETGSIGKTLGSF